MRLPAPRYAFAALLLAFAAFLSTTPVQAASAPGAGFRTLQLADPVNGGSMEAVVLYPVAHATAITTVGPYPVAAEAGAELPAGKHPLVLISHGHAGSRWGHHDLAEALARRGFIVAAIEHPGDNFHDLSGVGTRRVLFGRPLQIKALLTALLQNPDFGPHIDADRIGMAGFSAGGYTSLMVAGAHPDFSLIAGYCQRHPTDADICLHQVSTLAELQNPGDTADPRVRAFFVMAPFSIAFDQAGLADIQAPVFLYVASADQVLIASENGDHIRPLLKTLAGYRRVQGAGHYVFLAPCSPGLSKEMPEICIDPQGVDRVAVHRRINGDALKFFESALDWK